MRSLIFFTSCWLIFPFCFSAENKSAKRSLEIFLKSEQSTNRSSPSSTVSENRFAISPRPRSFPIHHVMLPSKCWLFLVPPNSEGIRRKPRLPWLYPMETFGCYDFYPRQHAKLYHATFPTTSWSADILLFFFITITLIFFPSPHILGSSNLRNTPMIQVLTRFHLDILHFSFAVFLEKQLQYRTKIRKNIE